VNPPSVGLLDPLATVSLLLVELLVDDWSVAITAMYATVAKSKWKNGLKLIHNKE
jgi:hypothetical protein